MSSPSLALLAIVAVVAALALLAGILLGRRSVVAGPGAPASPAPESVEESPELVAVLAAAAHATLGRPVVVRRISVLRSAGQENWSRVGRIDILRSHRLDPKR